MAYSRDEKMITNEPDSNELEYMYGLASATSKNSYAPYSKFSVGTCLKSSSGKYYTGCNIENASYSLVLCAEACALSHMVAAGERAIEAVVIVSSGEHYCYPCGACRQMLREFSIQDSFIYMYNPKQQFVFKRLSELLPNSFGPEHLGVDARI